MKELDRLYELLTKIELYDHAVKLLYFDFETIAPKASLEKESDTMNFLENEIFKISNTQEFKDLVVALKKKENELEPLDKILINYLYENYLKEKNKTDEFALLESKTFSQSFIRWQEARSKSDFSLFKDSLKKNIDILKQDVALREYKFDNVYDCLLDDHEKGMLQEDLDSFFEELKEGLIELLNKIKASKHHIRTDFLSREVPDRVQEEMSYYVLHLNGYDFNRGLLATTEHPFTLNVAQDDARVTTHYYPTMFTASLFSSIHEGGHAIFMLNEPKEDFKHFINDHISDGMHESVSRFYENVIGRSKEYIHLIYPKFKEIYKGYMDDVSEEELYEAINVVTPSLIRTEADEVTYGLHIIIRYEIEKKIFNGELSVDDIQKEWNKLYKEYLGVIVPDDRNGILQDVHWTGGFGYFPSYALGNAYNQMYLLKLEESFSLKEAILQADFERINNWMINNVFKEANHLSPKEWIKNLTGMELTPKPFLDYLNKKYSDIYKLKNS